jgi:NAD+ kinase
MSSTSSLPPSGLDIVDTSSNSPHLHRRPQNQNVVDSGSTTFAVGEAILRQYAHHLDPLHTDHQTHAVHEPPRLQPHAELKEDFVSSIPKASQDSQAGPLSPPSVPRPLRIPKTFLAHRKNIRSTDIPRQTIMKALASRPMAGPPTAPLSITSFRAALNETAGDQVSNTSTSPCLTATLAGIQAAANSGWSPASTNLLRSPCFFHQRFEGIVDIQKVLDDISEDEYSHSRLMQTATGVREVSKQLQRRPLKRAVKNVMIVTKARDNKLVYLTRDLAEWLLSTPRYGGNLGVNVYVDAKLRHSKRFDAAGLVHKEPRFQTMLKYWTPDLCWSSPEKFDLVLTLGGDGTVLFTSWLFQRIVPPILSFSLGSLGFLTNFEFDRYKEHLNNVMGDAGMRVNLRMRFTCTVWRGDTSPGAEKGAAEEGEQFEVLNELVIDRGPSAYVSNLELYGDNELLTIVQADGCIFSTPTGSTAYSLSAGGSLIHPSIPAILLTPICPHTLSFRPMVLSDALALRIAVPAKSRSSAYCSFDGKGRIELKQGDYVTLEASQYPFPTVMTGNNEWVESVQRALRWNVRGAVQKGWDDGNDEQGVEETWDIDADASAYNGTDSGIGPSEDGDNAGTTSPMRRQMSLLNM